MKFILASVFFFLFSSSISEQDITDIFNSSDLVVKAKVIDIRAVSGMKVICNLEIEKIYKGKRLTSVLIQLDEENEMDLYTSYLLYLEKSKDKNSRFFIKKRRVNESSEYFKNEISFITGLVNNKKFKKVKNPTPKHEIRFDCGCD